MSWREILKQNFYDWEKLAAFLELELSPYVSRTFPLSLPLRLAQKIEKGNAEDPILRQFLPTSKEERIAPGFLLDPVGDQKARKETKLLYKYEGRALVVASGACAMHCRFCFRRNFDYDKEDKLFTEELEKIGKTPSISEVILSGGDPLSLSNPILEELLCKLQDIPHVKKIRFHTRFPIGIPERIDSQFLSLLSKLRIQVVFVVHTNHPKELDSDIFAALKKMQLLAIPILTSSVLLRGVNDDVETLRTLFEMLTDHGILPYYLNQLDRVQGASHFEVPLSEGLELMRKLKTCLPGYAVPRYVQEIAGAPSKVEITSAQES